jgi:hypothetical protein
VLDVVVSAAFGVVVVEDSVLLLIADGEKGLVGCASLTAFKLDGDAALRLTDVRFVLAPDGFGCTVTVSSMATTSATAATSRDARGPVGVAPRGDNATTAHRAELRAQNQSTDSVCACVTREGNA